MKPSALTWLCLLFCQQQGSSCTCVLPTIGEALSAADAVFVGTVKQLIPTEIPSGPEGRRVRVIVNFDVSVVFKGDIQSVATLHTMKGGSGCGGIGFEKGSEYLIYATRKPAAEWFAKKELDRPGAPKTGDQLFDTSECLRTARLVSSQAQNDIRELRRLTHLK